MATSSNLASCIFSNTWYKIFVVEIRIHKIIMHKHVDCNKTKRLSI